MLLGAPGLTKEQEASRLEAIALRLDLEFDLYGMALPPLPGAPQLIRNPAAIHRDRKGVLSALQRRFCTVRTCWWFGRFCQVKVFDQCLKSIEMPQES